MPKKFIRLLACVACTLCNQSLHATGARLFKSGPIQITADGSVVWAANQDNDSVSRITTANDGVLEIPLPSIGTPHSPRGLSIKEDGSEVWVACHDSDRVYALSGSDGSVLAEINLPWGSGPWSVALSRDQRTALVTLNRSEGVAVIDVPTRAVSRILQPIYKSPMGIAWIDDGISAWVTHLFADGEHPRITRVDISGPAAKVKNIITVFATDPRSSSALAAPYNIAEGGYLTTRGHPAQIPPASGKRRVWLPVQYNNITEDTFSPDATVQAVIRRLDLNSRTIPNGTNDKVILTAVHVHDPAGSHAYLGPGWNAQVAGPVDIAFSTDGSMTYLLNELSNDIIPLPSSTTLVRPAAAAPLTEITVGNRPKGLAVSPTAEIAYVYNLFSRDVSVVDLITRTELRRIPVTPITGEPFSPAVLLGAKIFHSSDDPRISRNHKVSCASCHINSELDGRTWSFNRLPGLHGPRETPSLLGLSRTMGPRDPATGFGQLHRSGDRDEIQDFEHTFQGTNMGGNGFLGTAVRPELGASNAGLSPDLDALAQYLLSLNPLMRSPYRQSDGSLSEAAIRGATFFRGTNRVSKLADAGCIACHIPETGFADLKFHDVGSAHPGSERELNARTPAWYVNTPTLVGVWATSPYNGVSTFAETIMDVLKDQANRANTSTSHGKPDGLSKRQLADLAEFVLSIDGNMTADEVRLARDTQPPRIVRVEPTSLTRIDVWFSELVKRSTVTNPAQWRLETSTGQIVAINSVLWAGQNGDRVTLQTYLKPWTDYRLVPVGTILDEADTASGGTANTLDLSDPANTRAFSISNSLTITLGGSGYENITIPVHDSAMAGPGLSTWNHDSIWLFPISGTPKINSAFLRFDWKTNFALLTGVTSTQEILAASFSLHSESGEAQPIELRRTLQYWADPSTGGDYNQNATNAPTWRDHAHPNGRWNVAGAGSLGGTGNSAADYNSTWDLASRVDATNVVDAVNERIIFSGGRITEAFQFWFQNPSLDYGYAMRLNSSAVQALKFIRSESSLPDEGIVLQITYALPVTALTISRSGSSVILSWLLTPSGFSLEAASDISDNSWAPAGLAVTTTNGVNKAFIDTPSGQTFFRLGR